MFKSEHTGFHFLCFHLGIYVDIKQLALWTLGYFSVFEFFIHLFLILPLLISSTKRF